MNEVSPLPIGAGQTQKYQPNTRDHFLSFCDCGSILRIPAKVGVYRCGFCDAPQIIELRLLHSDPHCGYSGIVTSDTESQTVDPCAMLLNGCAHHWAALKKGG